MASAPAACSPSSLQLRFALNSGNCRKSPALLVRGQLWKQNRCARLLFVSLCVARSRSGPEKRRRVGVSWIRSDSAADGFAGWSGTDGGEESPDSGKKKSLGGAVATGLAGILLAAGLGFAALSLGRRINSEPKQMEPLTTQQEESLSDDKSGDIGGDEDKGHGEEQVDADSPGEGGTGTYKDSSSSSESVDVPSENRVGDDSVVGDFSVDDVKSTLYNNDAINNVSIREDSQHEPNFDDKSVEADTVPNSQNVLESENGNDSTVVSAFKDLDGNSAVGTSELVTELKDSPVDVGTTNLSVSDAKPSISPDNQDGTPDSVRDQTSENSSISHVPDESAAPDVPFSPLSNTILEPELASKHGIETTASSSTNENIEPSDISQISVKGNSLSLEVHSLSEGGLSSGTSVSASTSLQNEQFTINHNEINISTSESPKPGTSFSSAGIPAPSVVFSALQVLPGKVLVPAVVDQVQGQALAALQVLKVIESDVQPSELCTRREYARWLVSASSVLSRSTISKVYPAMYIENVTELAYDDITPEDPDFASIQGLAEAGLISSKLSRRDMVSSIDEDQDPLFFSPESPLSRQDLVSWKMALEKRYLPEADRKVLYEVSGFMDTDKIHPDACPALVADLSAGEQGITALAFGYTRLFQPDKPVTKAQAAIALATGEASDTVSEELARIEAESMAEKVVAAQSALVAQVEKDINASFEKELLIEKEKINAVEKMAEEATRELERLTAEREEDNIAILRERAAIESEMEVLSRLRREVEEQLQSLLSNKLEISYEKEKISKLRKEAEEESQEIERLQYELEVERKALSMARAWAEDEARRAREQAKALEEARDRWERHGIKVVVDNDLREESLAGVTWVDASKQFSVDGTVRRAENLLDKLKAMAVDVREKSRDTLNGIIEKIVLLISSLKEWASQAGKKAEDLRDTAISKASESTQKLQSKASESTQKLQQSATEVSLTIKEGAKRVAGDCRDGVEKLTQKFIKT